VAFEERFMGIRAADRRLPTGTLVLPLTLWWFRRYPRD